MKFRRNLFFPVRLILYPLLLEIILIVNGVIYAEWFWIAYWLVSTALLVEAIWEFIVPYATFDGKVFEINSYLFSRKRIDLSQHAADDVTIGRWDIEIGTQYINLRKVRRGYRERLVEAIQNYYEPDANA
jgi:hypothetical protein